MLLVVEPSLYFQKHFRGSCEPKTRMEVPCNMYSGYGSANTRMDLLDRCRSQGSRPEWPDLGFLVLVGRRLPSPTGLPASER